MKAIFHIGHHKTGTTSLQAYLAANGQDLLRRGILSPWVESQGAVWAQARMLSDDRADADLLPLNIREPHNALAFRLLAQALPEWKVPNYHRELPHPRQMLIAIRNQVELLTPETVVFCSEVMSHFGLAAPELISQLIEPIAGAEFGLHVTLRRPDDQLVAWYGQHLRFGRKARALSDPNGQDRLADLHFNYRAVIEPWLEHLPGVTARIRSYENVLAAGGSIPDFFNQWGLDLPSGAQDSPNQTPSLHRVIFPLLRHANAGLEPHAVRSLIYDMQEISALLELPAPRDIEFFGPTARAALSAQFAPIHAWLNEVSGHDPFFEDIAAISEVRPISEGQALRSLLDQLTPTHVERLTSPEARLFVSDLQKTYLPEEQC